MLRKTINRLKQIRSKEGIWTVIQKLEYIAKALFASVEIKSTFLNVPIAIPRTATGVLLISDTWCIKMGIDYRINHTISSKKENEELL